MSAPRPPAASAAAATIPPLLPNLLLFARALRAAGLPVSPDRTLLFLRALELVDVGERQEVFHAARSFLVYRQEDLRLFETLFNTFFRPPGLAPARGQKAPQAPRHEPPRERRFDLISLMAERARPDAREVDVGDKSATWSAEEVLQRKRFSSLTPEELAAVEHLIREMRWRVSFRTTRRRVPHHRGEDLHLRRVLREAARLGGTPLHLFHLTRKVKERPLVLLADISGSMERYSRLVLQLFYGITHGLRHVETFVFGTRLSRITPQLRLRNVDRAIEEASREVVDWAGGTRIAESLGTFNRRWARRVLSRGAIVIVVSDGWERGDPSELAREMRWLRHRCHRLVWLNPHLGQDSYRPLVEGMAAALPHVDDFLPVHNLQSLEELAAHLASLGNRPGRNAR